MVSSATLHNEDEVHRKDVCEGDTIIVHKAGDVIPEVVGPVLDKRPEGAVEWHMPETCPACGAPVVHEDGEVAYRCVSIDCPAQLKERLLHWVSRGCMDVDGVGEELVDKMIEAGLLHDVADFYRIAPRYGTNDDMKRLCEEAHARGIRIVLDLVAGHTSIEHPWFKASASAEKTAYDDYFVWTDGWGEKTGDYRFISGMEPRNGYFMINFFACQPAILLVPKT